MPPATVAHRPIDDLEGVGPSRAKHLKALGVNNLRDLVEYFPRTYQFESSELPISRLVPEQIQTVRGTVIAVNFIAGRGKARFEATIEDGSEKLAVVWFNANYVRRYIHPGLLIRVQGRVKMRGNMPQMINPKWQKVSDDTAVIEEEKFRPIYPASASLSSDNIGNIVAANL